MKSVRVFTFSCISLVLVFTQADQVLANAPKTPKIVFASNRDGNYEIYIMNTNGTKQVDLTRHKSVDVQPTWSPTGKEILFVSNRDGRPDLYLLLTQEHLILHVIHVDSL